MPTFFHPLAGLAAVAALASPLAWGADFTLNVPVSLSHLPNATALKVYCDVRAGGPSGVAVGSGSQRVPLTGADYSGVVTVAFDAMTTHPPGTASYYSCYLGLEGKSSKGAPFESSYMVLASDWLGATGQTLTVNPNTVGAALPGKK